MDENFDTKSHTASTYIMLAKIVGNFFGMASALEVSLAEFATRIWVYAKGLGPP
jgi:hypothetical protein